MFNIYKVLWSLLINVQALCLYSMQHSITCMQHSINHCVFFLFSFVLFFYLLLLRYDTAISAGRHVTYTEHSKVMYLFTPCHLPNGMNTPVTRCIPSGRQHGSLNLPPTLIAFSPCVCISFRDGQLIMFSTNACVNTLHCLVGRKNVCFYHIYQGRVFIKKYYLKNPSFSMTGPLIVLLSYFVINKS